MRDITQPDLKEFELALNSSVANYVADGFGPILNHYISYYTLPDVKVAGYDIKGQLLSPNKTTTLINIDIIAYSGDTVMEFIDWMDKELVRLRPVNATFEVAMTGTSVFLRESARSCFILLCIID